MMVPTPSCDDLRRLPCATPADQRDPRYLGDAAIRMYRELGLTRLLADLGWPADQPAVRVVGGIGSLVLRADTAPVWEPHVQIIVGQEPVAPELGAAREAACTVCPHYRSETDRCGLCGCGFVVAERARSAVARCPGGRW